MTFTGFLIIIGVFIALMFVYRRADKLIKNMSPGTVKKVNWAGFIIGILGGVAWYLFHEGIYMLVTLIGIVIYFLFYGYDKMESNESH
ncbi:MAG: hypothetical protein HY954_01125 [Deltaproteobacteria bacterium]|nr:hypothetical protein [Deltaproteobacteria bacterium]